MTQEIIICTTCDRQPEQASGNIDSRRLREDIRTELMKRPLSDLELREVGCLGGCLRICNVALRGQGRYSLRFSEIRPSDVIELCEAAERYWAHETGAPDGFPMPDSLRLKMTACIPPV